MNSGYIHSDSDFLHPFRHPSGCRSFYNSHTQLQTASCDNRIQSGDFIANRTNQQSRIIKHRNQQHCNIHPLTTVFAEGTFSYMTTEYRAGDTVYIIENASRIREATVVRTGAGFCTLRFSDGGGTRLRESRLFPSRKQAEVELARMKAANREDTSASCPGSIDWLG